MLTITEFLPALADLLPETHAILAHANLVVHDAVIGVTLLGSRGLAGGCRPDSDVDLSLMVDARRLPAGEPARADLLREVLQTTLAAWRGSVDLDTAAVFDTGGCCGLRCFNTRDYDAGIIGGRGIDCFGIYKIQRGFDGYVTDGVRLDAMYPMLAIWRG